MSAIDDLFQQLRAKGEKALMPFITAGDPDIAFTGELIETLADAGAAMCEVGVPYSDPVADGPVIQESYQRALDSKFRLEQLFEMAANLPKQQAPDRPAMPLVTMVSYSIINRIGLETYVQRALAAGYSGAIVPDLLVEESAKLTAICKAHDFSLIQLVTPTTPRDRQIRIAESSTGFLYFVSVTGITGERTELPTDLVENVSWLKEQTDLPICIGFGISGPETAKRLAPVADGLIVGSAFVRRIASVTPENRQQVLTEVGSFARSIIKAMH
ncbi:Tryptophan synthase alpha chain [Roseimaritima multifibrata]|uniref:Tryptophan synthase alpha chain n=1 Tax=Roseimaritima multifibrata TaxID=1930274 RepID=A0A517MKC2_9BACT|nr:tryptophan synthase subunit alpha [Roseimaritima multifibrata]QDS95341.1 Tryptophan synthase alpha chain [Roseimaritima multifibrata]